MLGQQDRGAEEASVDTRAVGLHRVLEPRLVLPQAAARLDPTPLCGPDEVLVAVERLNLDAASFRQLREQHGTGESVRAAVLAIVASRGKVHNPVTGSGGMLVGTVAQVGHDNPLGLLVGQRIATLVSLTLTPLHITSCDWDGRSEQVPCTGTAVLFARSVAAVLPEDLPVPLALAVLDVCGAPALLARVLRGYQDARVVVLGAGGKSGALCLAAARRCGAASLVGVVPDQAQARRLRAIGLADEVVVADARDPVAVAEAVGEQAEVTVVCVDVGGCEGGAILATRDGGTVIFFSMATSFSCAALTAEGLGADVTMLIGNGYTPGHAALALDLLRTVPAVRSLFEERVGAA
jgi:L-erythro-3,5-diaminohexanoate dehydrogenase